MLDPIFPSPDLNSNRKLLINELPQEIKYTLIFDEEIDSPPLKKLFDEYHEKHSSPEPKDPKDDDKKAADGKAGTNKRRQLDDFLAAVRDDMSRVYKVTEDGKHHQSRRAVPASKPFEINAADCALWASGLVFDTRDPEHCVLVQLSDVATEAFDMEFVGTELEGVHYPDRELLYFLEFGCRLKSKFPFAAVVCPPHVSARPWMRELVEQVNDEFNIRLLTLLTGA